MKKKKKLLIVGVAIAVLAIGATIAVNNNIANFANLFGLGVEESEFVETFDSPDNWQPCQETPKTFVITNKNATPRYARMKISEYWRTKDSTTSSDDHETSDLALTWTDDDGEHRYAIINFDNQDDWEYRDDGWYYYKYSLYEGASTSSMLKSVTLNCDLNFSTAITTGQDGTSSVDSPHVDYADAEYHVYVVGQISSNPWGLSTHTLYKEITQVRENNGLDTNIDFAGVNGNAAVNPDGGNGINIMASTKDDAHPVYYFRGSITDNYVIWANMCWKIVRTTSTGGTKIIYSSEVENVDGVKQCPGQSDGIYFTLNGSRKNMAYYTAFNQNDGTSIADVGYMYGERVMADVSTLSDDEIAAAFTNTTNSQAKDIVETWFETHNLDGHIANTKNYENDLEDTVFCNDRSYTRDGSTIWFGSHFRNEVNYAPSVECPNVNDAFTKDPANGNGKLAHKVGLLTSDEAALAGVNDGHSFNDAYIYLGYFGWTMTPERVKTTYSGGVMHPDSNVHDFHTLLGYAGVNSGFEISYYPMVSLRNEIQYIEGGTGTKTNPYVIVE